MRRWRTLIQRSILRAGFRISCAPTKDRDLGFHSNVERENVHFLYGNTVYSWWGQTQSATNMHNRGFIVLGRFDGVKMYSTVQFLLYHQIAWYIPWSRQNQSELQKYAVQTRFYILLRQREGRKIAVKKLGTNKSSKMAILSTKMTQGVR